MSIGLVIARYNEDISWSDKFDVDKFIYNKGDSDIDNSIKLENIGLEPHTFLYHIINNYENLSDYTFFLQGCPHDHCQGIENKINEYINGNVKHFELLGDIEGVENIYGWDFVTPCYRSCFGKEPDAHNFFFRHGGQFVVSKEKILINNLEKYKHFYNIFYLNPSDPLYAPLGGNKAPDFGLPHFFERFWGFTFGENNLDDRGTGAYPVV
jgi:hypothetical protein